jgi:copper homeostasis protein CutC
MKLDKIVKWGLSVVVCFHRAFDMTRDATEGGVL